jgi:hypothetical protein
MECIASGFVGAAIGLIAVAMFAVSLKLHTTSKLKEVVQALGGVAKIALGGGVGDYLVFKFIINSDSLLCYLIGLTIIFLTFGLYIFVEFLR